MCTFYAFFVPQGSRGGAPPQKNHIIAIKLYSDTYVHKKYGFGALGGRPGHPQNTHIFVYKLRSYSLCFYKRYILGRPDPQPRFFWYYIDILIHIKKVYKVT